MSPWRYFGWVVVAVSLFNLIINMGTRNSFSVFLVAISGEFSWSRSGIAGVYSLSSLLFGLLAPFMGRLLDRFDARRMVPISAAIFAVGLFLSSMASDLWHFYLTFGIISGIGACGTWIVPHTLMISRWFQRRRGLAMSIAYMGTGLGIFAVVPITQYLIDILGWRKAFMCQGLGVLLLMAPLSYLVFRRVPPQTSPSSTVPPANEAVDAPAYSEKHRNMEQGEIWTLRLARRTVFFWAIFFIYIFTSVGIIGVVIHLAAYLVSLGYSKMTAAMALSIMGLISAPGRILFGLLTDRISGRFALILSYTCNAVGILALLGLYYVRLPIILYFFVFIFGIAFGARTSVVGPMVANAFQGPNFGLIFGFITIGMGLGATIGPWLMGYLYDITGDYRASIMVGLVSVFMGIICACFTGPKNLVRSRSKPFPDSQAG
ncbi:MAG: MFS transporter [Deltaproteobacteria bacterium]|nr:MFS transporter [Deltaproteobacteria bacterium]